MFDIQITAGHCNSFGVIQKGLHLNFHTSSGRFFSYQLPLEAASVRPGRSHLYNFCRVEYGIHFDWVRAVYSTFDGRWEEIESDYDLENIR